MNWDDLVYLATLNLDGRPWGLRHVSTGEGAAKECAEGFTGDALAISAVNYLVDPSEEVSRSTQALAKVVMSKVAEGERAGLCSRFEDAVTRFLTDSLMMDLNLDAYQQAADLGAVLDLLAGTSGPAFIVACFSGGGYDVARYYGLGKYGKRAVRRQEVLTTLSLAAKDVGGFGLDRDEKLDKKAATTIASKGAVALYAKLAALVANQRR